MMRQVAFYLLVLLLFGDFELNPGSLTEQEVNEILKGQNSLMDKLVSIEESQKSSDVCLHDLCTRVDSIETNFRRLAQTCAVLNDFKKQMKRTEELPRLSLCM